MRVRFYLGDRLHGRRLVRSPHRRQRTEQRRNKAAWSNPGVKFGHCQMRRYSAPSGGSAPAAADGAASRRDPSRDPVPIHDHAGRIVTRNVKSNRILCHGLHLRY